MCSAVGNRGAGTQLPLNRGHAPLPVPARLQEDTWKRRLALTLKRSFGSAESRAGERLNRKHSTKPGRGSVHALCSQTATVRSDLKKQTPQRLPSAPPGSGRGLCSM
ncbi:hypothetical protein NDU88_001814 [Pleurodeles waltl]|uniref:Uncharacterized protein n=1 Tax=Pleurodeles waltl TaxID=8319 RepID=A0AAV7UVA5_PLEWA|nr:hypothetical protein NDU88_001814 [Pleurodeles waltl]